MVRGLVKLMADGKTSMGMTREGVLELGLRGLFELVKMVNLYGQR